MKHASFEIILFAKTIQSKRKWSEQTLREAAKQIGISAATLSRAENNRIVDLLTYKSICNWLGLDMEYFFTSKKSQQ